MQRILLGFCLLILVLSAGCSKYVIVTIDPKVDLKEAGTIGVVRFSLEGSEIIAAEEVTQRFLATIQGSQPGVRLLELGPEPEILKTIKHERLDSKAIRAIGREYGVDMVLTGVLSVSELKPSFSLSQAMTSMSAQASVNGSLRGKLRETSSGATLWTNGAHGKWNVAGVSLDGNGRANAFGLTDPQQKYENMLNNLVDVATGDFRPTYVRRKVAD